METVEDNSYSDALSCFIRFRMCKAVTKMPMLTLIQRKLLLLYPLCFSWKTFFKLQSDEERFFPFLVDSPTSVDRSQ